MLLLVGLGAMLGLGLPLVRAVRRSSTAASPRCTSSPARWPTPAATAPCPTSLLGRVRELLQAEYATLWLPAQGRYPEVLLSARVDAPGLLDVTSTPVALRQRASPTARPSPSVRRRRRPEPARHRSASSGVKDAIVVPLRSGSAVIGTLEVAGRLGDMPQFAPGRRAAARDAGRARRRSRWRTRAWSTGCASTRTTTPSPACPTAAGCWPLLEEAVKVRAPGEVVAVLLFDIDGLRDVNDSLGHDAGDKMVVEVAARLRRLAPAAALVGRVGGDEFVVTLRLPDADDGRDAGRPSCAPRCSEPMDVDAITLDVDAAVGIAVHPDHGTEPEVLLKRADLAAHAAKQLADPGAAVPPEPGVPLDAPARASPPTCAGRWRTARSRSTSSPRSRCPTAAWSAWSAWPGGSTRRTARSPRRTSWRSPSTPASSTGSPRSSCGEGLRRAPRAGSTRAARCRSRSTSPPVP